MGDFNQHNMALPPHAMDNTSPLLNTNSLPDAGNPFSGLDSYQAFNPSDHLGSPNLQRQSFPYNAPPSLSGLSDAQSPASSAVRHASFSNAGSAQKPVVTGSMEDFDHNSPGSVMTGLGGKANNSDKSLVSHGAEDDDEKSRYKGKDKDNDRDVDSTEPQPAWAELKTKAGKDRKRLPLACITCRRKKIRCSGEKPACRHCMRSRIPCVYKVTTRKAAPRTDYMAMLDKRLKRMEERVIKIMPKDEQRNVDVIGRAVVKPAVPGLPPKAESKKRAASEAFGEGLDNWAKMKAGGSKDASDARNKALEAARDDLMTEGSEYLPPMELQQHLAEVFFDFVYGQSYHLLHRPSYMRKLEAGQLPPVVVLTVCAISARFSSHPGVRTEPAFLRGEKWAKPARAIALKRYDTPNITILICYLLLGLHEFGTCQGGRSWMLGGMAQRMAYALQLHKDLEPVGPTGNQEDKNDLTHTDHETRRRTMWSCFMMDRFNSSGTDRPMFVTESYIEAQLPIKEHYFQMEINGPTEKLEGPSTRTVEPDSGQVMDPKENMGVAAYLVRAVSIWGQVVRYINLGGKERDARPMWSEESGFSKLRKLINDYKTKLPRSLHWNEENLRNHSSEKIANQFIFLHIILNQINLFMNRFALPITGSRSPLTKDMPPEFVSECARTALDAAGQISALVNEAHDQRVVAPFAGYSAFLSSTVHIHGLSSKNPAIESSSKQYLAWNVKYLTKMKKYWGMFHFVTEHLRDLYRRQMDANIRMQQGTATPNGAKGQEGIFQYGDWFDRYPHGVSGTDYEEAGNEVKKEPITDAIFGQKPDLQSVEEFFSKMSPPSRTGQARKAAKRKQSKSALQKTTNASDTAEVPVQAGPSDATTSEQQQPQPQQPQQFQPQAQQQGISQMNPAFQNGNPQFATQQPFSPLDQRQFPQGLTPNDLAILQQAQQYQLRHPGIMSHLDRHMVLSSYAGMGNTSDTPSNPPDLDGMDPSAAAAAAAAMSSFPQVDVLPQQQQQQQQQFGFQGDQDINQAMGWNDAGSLSWFMPFNLEPPSGLGGDESSLFGGGYDFGSLDGFETVEGMEGLEGMRDDAEGA